MVSARARSRKAQVHVGFTKFDRCSKLENIRSHTTGKICHTYYDPHKKFSFLTTFDYIYREIIYQDKQELGSTTHSEL